jgi:hypothetical protein
MLVGYNIAIIQVRICQPIHIKNYLEPASNVWWYPIVAFACGEHVLTRQLYNSGSFWIDRIRVHVLTMEVFGEPNS